MPSKTFNVTPYKNARLVIFIPPPHSLIKVGHITVAAGHDRPKVGVVLQLLLLQIVGLVCVQYLRLNV